MKWTLGLTLAAAMMVGPVLSGVAQAQPRERDTDRRGAVQDDERAERLRELQQRRLEARDGAADRPQRPAAAGQAGIGMGPGGAGPLALLRGMDLTDEQRVQLREVIQEYGPASEAGREHARQLNEVNQQMLQAREQNDRRQFIQLAGQLYDVLGNAPPLHDEIRNLLTPEQRRQYDENLEQTRQRPAATAPGQRPAVMPRERGDVERPAPRERGAAAGERAAPRERGDGERAAPRERGDEERAGNRPQRGDADGQRERGQRPQR